MREETINKAISIIDYAVANNISVKMASIKNGYAGSYVKNIKADIQLRYTEALDNGDISNFQEIEELMDRFMGAYKVYESSRKTNHIISDPSKKKNETLGSGEQVKITRELNLLNVEWENKSEEEINTEGENSAMGTYPENHIKTLDELISECDIDLEEWRVVRHIVNKWDVTSWKRGYPETWENFQVKATLEKIKEVHQAKQLHEIFSDLIKDYTPPTATAVYKQNHDDLKAENNLLEVTLFDLHMGKLGWAGEVGENYDTKIAYARFIDAINNLLIRAKGFEYSKIVFPIGNDFFNSDNMNNTTTAGTPQDEDLRWQKTFKLGCQLLVSAIGLLKETGVPVDVLIIPGNHDWERSYYLGTVLEAWFKDDTQVNVDNGAMPRKYYSFGDVLLGYTHGKEEKENGLPMLMAVEEPLLWGSSKFREWHLGHFHKKRNLKITVLDKAQILNEDNGVIVRYLSSLSGTEEWHFKKGYVGAHKAGEAFIWNDKSGMIGHLNFNFTDFNREH